MPGKRGRSCAGAGNWVTCVLLSELQSLIYTLSYHHLVPFLLLSDISWLMLQLSPVSPLAACFHVQSHPAQRTLNSNHAAAQPKGETVMQDPFTNPLAPFSSRCKFRVGDAWRAKLDYCFLCFPKGHEDAGMLRNLLPGSEKEALLSPRMPCLESLLRSSGLSFLQ